MDKNKFYLLLKRLSKERKARNNSKYKELDVEDLNLDKIFSEKEDDILTKIATKFLSNKFSKLLGYVIFTDWDLSSLLFGYSIRIDSFIVKKINRKLRPLGLVCVYAGINKSDGSMRYEIWIERRYKFYMKFKSVVSILLMAVLIYVYFTE